MIDQSKQSPESETPSSANKLKLGLQLIGGYVNDIIRLDEGVDKLATIQEIKENNSLSGANAWMLMCSIMIASVGLDLNSPAVIIGGMLISPLMAPILGLGLAVGINDKETLKKSLRNFFAAIAIALLTSTIYFKLSPFGEITTEIAARLEPTFLDVVVAIFGGIAGIVSIARKDISMALPGVAIATALMPPLCVTGFGIANWDWVITSHSFYLFFLNTVFVAFATYILVRYLDFPHRDYVNPAERNKAIGYITLFIVLTIVPSFFIFKRVLTRLQSKVRVETFVNEYLADDRLYLDDYELMTADSSNTLVLKVYGNNISKSRIPDLERGLQATGLKNTKIRIISTSEIHLDQVRNLQNQVDGVRKMAKQLELANVDQKQQSTMINSLTDQMKASKIDSLEYKQIQAEVQVMIPEISTIVLGQGSMLAGSQCLEDVPITVAYFRPGIELEADRQRAIEKQLRQYIRIRLQKDSAIVVSQLQ